MEEAQCDAVRHFLPYAVVPVVSDVFVRGVLPVVRPDPVVRVAVSIHGEYDLSAYIAYEIPIKKSKGVRSAGEMLRIVMRHAAGTQFYSNSEVSSALGMTVVSLRGSALRAGEESHEERATEFLQALAEPYVDEPPSPAVRGFLLMGPETLRMYVSGRDVREVIGADVKVGKHMTSLLAALPSLVEEPERQQDSDDPHCTRVVDLLEW
ncbi:hypothetical protein [Streptomyces sp. SID11385]|uniref:hypothetical protein n=1 Tax=Streptomyces sp. SID11385 TaxID=2706031 RepID=UPI0013CB529F|nr:hypothetical protein [Streptomyces sp. SID11385]NEA42005.1 hypothetical protein [Streptomyces sp. SID11385]